MNATRTHRWAGVAGLCLVILWTCPVSAQTFSSGSTGADGAFSPVANTTLTMPPDGVFNFTTVNIPAGVIVTFVNNAANTPVTMLATGDVTIAGTLKVNGAMGALASTTGPPINPGGSGGPGGFAGGQGGSRGPTNNGGSAGQGPGGGTPGAAGVFTGGSYGAPASFIALLPLFGGSGGGGATGEQAPGLSGASGSGGGGAILIASSTKIAILAGGAITANGGEFSGFNFCVNSVAGNGSGGAIRLVASQISSQGILEARGGTGGCGSGTGGAGRIRLEAMAFGPVATTNPAASFSTTLGPVTAASIPALVNLPTLAISSVGGVASPAMPGGAYSTADVSLPSGTTNPVPVTLTAMNIPLGTVFTVKLIPQFAAPTSVSSSASTGAFTSSTATASVTFPTAQVSVLNAFASFTLPAQTASLFPSIDGEPVERILLAATAGEPSRLMLVTRSGREVPLDRLSSADQLAVAKGWSVLQGGR